MPKLFKIIVKRILPYISILFFILALWVLHRELRTYRYHEVMAHLESLPKISIGLAFLFTFLSYLVLIGYDMLAFSYVKRKLGVIKIALASFIGYAYSNSIGHSLITGGSVRYRLYSGWGVSGEDVSKIVAFCTLTFWIGVLALGGILFLSQPLPLPSSWPVTILGPKIIAVVFVLLLGMYFGLVMIHRQTTVQFLGWSWELPSPKVALNQIIISSMDWVFSAAVLFSLLPFSSDLSFIEFLSAYMLAQVFALVSQVPAGLGVFETLIVFFLSPHYPASVILASLLAYRGIYCLVPLGVASLLFGFEELTQKKEGFKQLATLFGGVVPRAIPTLFSFAAFVGGTVLLISGATPAIPHRLTWLQKLFPLGVIELSHFLGSLAGAGLLLLARGLGRRLDAAYHLTILLFGIGIATSLLKGFDYEEATILTLLMITLWSCRHHFYRKAMLWNDSFSPAWIAAIVVIVAGSVWLGFFVHKHVDYSSDLWWRFSLRGDAPRFLRASVGAIGALVFYMAAKLLHPSVPEPIMPTRAEWETAKAVIKHSPLTYPHLALLGDKALLFNDSKTAFLMYGVQGRSWVAMGDPVGPEKEISELIWRFREMADAHDGWTVFYEINKTHLPLYIDQGLTLLKLGEEARVALENFSLEGSDKKGLRYTRNQLEKKGCSVEIQPEENSSVLFPDLKNISNAWLAEKKTKEKGFSLGFYNEKYLKNFPIALVRREGKIVAFANIWSTESKNELSIDLMRFLPEAPGGVMEYLFIEMMIWGSQQGYQWFNLGMAPLSGLQNRTLAPLWNKVGNFIYRHGENFYNFEGLRLYKEKFHPLWEPKFLAAPSGFRLPMIFANVSSLISGGLKGVIAK